MNKMIVIKKFWNLREEIKNISIPYKYLILIILFK